MSADYRIPDPSKPCRVWLRCWACSKPIGGGLRADLGHEQCVRNGRLLAELDYDDDNLEAR